MTTFGELCCEVCGIKGSEVAMHRANPTGEKGRWRCEGCMTVPIDPDVLWITDALGGDGGPRRLLDGETTNG